MTKITKEELHKLAKLSHIYLPEEEASRLVTDIDNVLNYAVRVCEIAADTDERIQKNVNVMREDTVVPTPPQPLLEKAPERVEDFFVVPMILESNK